MFFNRSLMIVVALTLLAGITGCGQGEPDRYKAKGTERPSKSVPGADGPLKSEPKGPTPPKGDAAEKPKETKTPK